MKTTEAEVKKTHEELVAIDGTAPMLSWGTNPTGNVTDAEGYRRGGP